jgi:hypothetical protein
LLKLLFPDSGLSTASKTKDLIPHPFPPVQKAKKEMAKRKIENVETAKRGKEATGKKTRANRRKTRKAGQ